MRRRSALATFAATGLWALRPQRLAAQGAPLPKIRVAAIESDALTPLFYAMRNGLFQKAGLDVEFVSTNNGTAATTAVLAGTYELSYPSIVTTMNAHLRDVPLVLVAPGGVYTPKNPFGLLQVAADSPIKTAADLNGKVIGVLALNSFSGLVVSAWVDKNGGDSRTLKYVEIPFAVTEAALVEHRIDCSMMLEPMLTSSLSSGTTRTLGDAFSAIANTFMFAAYVGRPDWASQNADTVHKFHRRYQRASYRDGGPDGRRDENPIAYHAENAARGQRDDARTQSGAAADRCGCKIPYDNSLVSGQGILLERHRQMTPGPMPRCARAPCSPASLP
jgi:NitT/TauT family transport system substrate-binding protein